MRFDLASAKLILNSYDDDVDYSYIVHSVKLWTEKIIPDPSALLSLNKSLLNNKRLSILVESLSGDILQKSMKDFYTNQNLNCTQKGNRKEGQKRF